MYSEEGSIVQDINKLLFVGSSFSEIYPISIPEISKNMCSGITSRDNNGLHFYEYVILADICRFVAYCVGLS